MAPSTPPPPNNDPFAALTIASSNCFVISPVLICNVFSLIVYNILYLPFLTPYLLYYTIKCKNLSDHIKAGINKNTNKRIIIKHCRKSWVDKQRFHIV